MSLTALLCHASADADLAGRVAAALERAGIRCRLVTALYAGQPPYDIEGAMAASLAACDVFVVVLTDAAARSSFVVAECRIARAHGVRMAVLRVGRSVLPADAPPALAGIARFDAGDGDDESLRRFAAARREDLLRDRLADAVESWEDASEQAPSARPAPAAAGDVDGDDDPVEEFSADADPAPSPPSRPTEGLRGVGSGRDAAREDLLREILRHEMEERRRAAPAPEGVGSGWGTPPPTSGPAPLPRAAPSAPSAARDRRQAPLSPARARGALGRVAWHATGVLRGLASVGRRVGRFGHGLSLRRDAVDCTVFAPPRARAPSTVLVQVFLHVPERAAEARASAEDADPGATKRGTQSLSMRLRRGTVVTVNLKGPFIPPEGRSEDVRYDGRTTSATFFVVIPAGFAQDAWFGCATVLVGDPAVPIGRIRFRIAVGGEASSPQPVGEARAHRHAFLSYASPDRPHVARVADSLARAGIDFFQDVLSLEPGEKWRPRLRREIERSDLFVLFWSEAAAQSTWVGWEVDEALTRKAGDDEKPPDIVPLTVGGTAPPPPPRLAHVHFGPPERWSVTSDAG